MPAQQLSRNEGRVHRLFQISLLLKAAHSLLEIISGILLTILPQEAILRIAKLLTQEELLEDPRDAIANYILKSARSLSVGKKSAAAFFLVSHGVVKLSLIVAILRNKAWAYPAFIFALGLLIAYQCYQLLHVFSIGLTALTILDAIVLGLAWHEYRFMLASDGNMPPRRHKGDKPRSYASKY
jgi:uncharacterized membrane protein